jgi:hypothetical protein
MPAVLLPLADDDFEIAVQTFAEQLFAINVVLLYRMCGIAKKNLDILRKNKTLQKRRKLAPSISMWEGYETALSKYYNVLMKYRSEFVDEEYENLEVSENFNVPSWYGNSFIHYSHQAEFLRQTSSEDEMFTDLPECYRNKGLIYPSDDLKELNPLSPPDSIFSPIEKIVEKDDIKYFPVSFLRKMTKDKLETKGLKKIHLYYIVVNNLTIDEAKITVDQQKSDSDNETSSLEKEKKGPGRKSKGATVKQLQEVAKRNKISGASKMKKENLQKHLIELGFVDEDGNIVQNFENNSVKSDEESDNSNCYD